MVVANSDGHRRNFAPVEEAAALFAAHEAGASRTRIRKFTGRKAEDIKTALAAGKMSADTRAAAGDLAAQLSLDELALLAEFDGEEAAVATVLEALRRGLTVEYVAERIRQDRAEAAQHEQLVAELEAAGVRVTDALPDGAARLAGLVHDGADLTPEAHAGCPGRGAYFQSWNLAHPVHYCAAPAEHGHTVRTFGPPPPAGGGAPPVAAAARSSAKSDVRPMMRAAPIARSVALDEVRPEVGLPPVTADTVRLPAVDYGSGACRPRVVSPERSRPGRAYRRRWRGGPLPALRCRG